MGAHNSHRAVGIGWNEWSASIGTRGRHPLERVVDFSGIRNTFTPSRWYTFGLSFAPGRAKVPPAREPPQKRRARRGSGSQEAALQLGAAEQLASHGS